MIDKIKFAIQGIPLKPDAIIHVQDGTTHGFKLKTSVSGRDSSKQNGTFLYPALGSEIVTVFTRQVSGIDWRITAIEANLPKLLWGHNGRLLKTADDLHLALTRLRHVVGQLIPKDFWRHLLPDPSREDSLAFISRVELPWHVHDPDNRLLLASHSARYPRLRKQPLVVHGETSTFRGSSFDLCIYDKALQAKEALQAEGELVAQDREPWVRLEARFKNPDRLHRVAIDAQHDEPAALRTLAFEDAYRLLRHEIESLEGLWDSGGLDQQSDEWKKAGKMSRVLAAIAVTEDIPLPRLLERYKQVSAPADKTFKQVRLCATRLVAASRRLLLDDFLPATIPVNPPEVFNLEREHLHQRVAALWKWPVKPDPDIVEAWSYTTEIVPKPSQEARLANPETKWGSYDTGIS